MGSGRALQEEARACAKPPWKKSAGCTWGTEEDCREKAREGTGASGNGEPHEAHNEEMGRPWGP